MAGAQRLRSFACTPVFTAAPMISGVAQVGQTLTSDSGTIRNGSVTGRQWKRGGADIAGATGATYVCQAADVDSVITVEVTATNQLNTRNAVAATTAPTAAVVA
jgi:hypothetical protein